MHTHFTQLYIAGNFPYLTDVVRISGREWGPTRPSHHFEPFPIHVVFAISVRVNNPWPNATFFQCPNVLHFHVLLWKSIQSCAIDYFKSHLLAQHSTNEGESATNIEWYPIWNITTYKLYTTCPSLQILKMIEFTKIHYDNANHICSLFDWSISVLWGR